MRQPVSHYPESHFADSDYDRREEDYGVVGDERTEEPLRRDRRLPAIILTIAVMAVFAGGLWFAYVQGTRQTPVAAAQRDGVPLLRADERPTKVKPDQPGGMKVPDQNISLYNDKPGAAGVEKLLPQAEQPMTRPAPAPEAASPTPPAAAPATAPAGPPVVAFPPQPPAASAAKPAAKAPAEPKPAPPAEAAATGKIEVRLASVRSADAARGEWTRLKQENADLLGNLHANAVRTDLGDKGIYYRIQAGPFADAAAAERLCAELKRRNHGCILAR